ncbi:MAG: tRNA threonylcarbamoyladenosine dehydratase [Muribaculaceae bacterium]|nr:tRNA threonylcarbamoyladenosine dehydratase [Muribaculaceae bacterium]
MAINIGSSEPEAHPARKAEWDSRTRLLIGDEGTARLSQARVFVAGVGGVGGYAAEMLARSGVGHLTLVDADIVSASNLNRQLIATIPSIGLSKSALFKDRFLQINPDIEVETIEDFITPDNAVEMLDEGNYDFVVDAIDTVAPKVAIIAYSQRKGIRIISSMGAGGRLDPTRVGYFDLWETREDGLARAVRQRLKKMGLRRPLKVVASSEAPRQASIIRLDERNKRSSYGTVATIPSLFGIYMAAHVINTLTK